MTKKILSIVLMLLLVISLFVLTGCENQNSNSGENLNSETSQSENKEKEADAINDNSNYFVKINGKKFKAGDKISSVSKVGLSQDEKVLDEKVKKNTYVIGAGGIYNENKKRVLNMTPYNSGNEEITVADAVIGGLEVGDYQYDKISQEVLDLEVEVAGGIKLGSTLKDVEKVFGETDNTYFAESLGYTTYTYKSDEIYRSYEFTIDKDGKVAKIYWQNLVFND